MSRRLRDYDILKNLRLEKEILHYIARDDSTSLTRLFRQVRGLAKEDDRHGDPFLYTAIWMGAVECVLAFIKYGANINPPTGQGQPPEPYLHAAAFHAGSRDERGDKCLEIMRILLDEGIDTTLRNGQGQTALEYVQYMKQRYEEDDIEDIDYERVLRVLRAREQAGGGPKSLFGMARSVLRNNRPETYGSLPPYLMEVAVGGYAF